MGSRGPPAGRFQGLTPPSCQRWGGDGEIVGRLHKGFGQALCAPTLTTRTCPSPDVSVLNHFFGDFLASPRFGGSRSTSKSLSPGSGIVLVLPWFIWDQAGHGVSHFSSGEGGLGGCSPAPDINQLSSALSTESLSKKPAPPAAPRLMGNKAIKPLAPMGTAGWFWDRQAGPSPSCWVDTSGQAPIPWDGSSPGGVSLVPTPWGSRLSPAPADDLS